MTTVLRREFYDVKRGHVYRIIPLGDIHLGSVHCDEGLLADICKRIAREPNTFWVGMGDYCEFINRQDPRYDPREFAEWMQGVGDLAGAEVEHLLDYLRPIAKKCLGLLSGNHEESIYLHYERDIMSEIVRGIKDCAGWDAEHKLRLDYYGWMRLYFYRSQDKEHSSVVTFNLHHGHGGGKLAGGKALNIQRHIWTHQADVILFGHSHNIEAQVEAVERLDDSDNIITDCRRGAYAGTFLSNAGYAIRKGFLPIPLGGCEIYLRPGADKNYDRVRIMT